MGSMHTMLEDIDGGIERLAQFYRERARGQVGLIVTGGVSPTIEGGALPTGKYFDKEEASHHQLVTDAVHQEGGKICLQLLHVGRYGFSPANVSASDTKAPITPFGAKALTEEEIEKIIQAYADASTYAAAANYDGVEIMGSEGYLINQFIAQKTNRREDQWGGSYENRIRFALDIVRRVRAAVGERFIIIYRLSMLDLVQGGSTWEEVVQLAKAIEKAGATIINTGIGWHESRIPTIGTVVPKAGFAWVTKRMMGEVNIPLVATNRINMPDVAEQVLADGNADLVSMARPFLADPELVLKAIEQRSDEINTCIACNQACLDHTFSMKVSTCIVNPRACHETLLNHEPADKKKKIAIIGGGPAGMEAARVCAVRGHEVHLYESESELGGQFNMAMLIPGKEEYAHTMRYYTNVLKKLNVQLHLSTKANAEMLSNAAFDDIVIATGVHPRKIAVDGIDHEKVLDYQQVLRGEKQVGASVAIIGAGGIGFDVAEYLSHDNRHDSPSLNVEEYMKEWGVDMNYTHAGALAEEAQPLPSARKVYLLKRSKGKHGKNLGKTTGWIHRSSLKMKKVEMLAEVEYLKVDDQGLHINVAGDPRILPVDHVVVCAGQESNNMLFEQLKSCNLSADIHLIGGAHEAKELDAYRAIKQAAELCTGL